MADQVVIRPVAVDDAVNGGFFEVLSQLTEAPTLPRDQFERLLCEQQRQDMRLTLVAVNTSSGRVVGTGSVLIECKFIRGGKPCGHIEDIVVDKAARGANVGKRVISQLVDFCKQRGCYKVILDCADYNVPFYERCGFVTKELQMVQYL